MHKTVVWLDMTCPLVNPNVTLLSLLYCPLAEENQTLLFYSFRIRKGSFVDKFRPPLMCDYINHRDRNNTGAMTVWFAQKG